MNEELMSLYRENMNKFFNLTEDIEFKQKELDALNTQINSLNNELVKINLEVDKFSDEINKLKAEREEIKKWIAVNPAQTAPKPNVIKTDFHEIFEILFDKYYYSRFTHEK